MLKNAYWDIFVKSGMVEDYLVYCGRLGAARQDTSEHGFGGEYVYDDKEF
jgi:hypothetical protein